MDASRVACGEVRLARIVDLSWKAGAACGLREKAERSWAISGSRQQQLHRLPNRSGGDLYPSEAAQTASHAAALRKQQPVGSGTRRVVHNSERHSAPPSRPKAPQAPSYPSLLRTAHPYSPQPATAAHQIPVDPLLLLQLPAQVLPRPVQLLPQFRLREGVQRVSRRWNSSCSGRSVGCWWCWRWGGGGWGRSGRGGSGRGSGRGVGGRSGGGGWYGAGGGFGGWGWGGRFCRRHRGCCSSSRVVREFPG